jgi:Reverse transcriptase (RNA-dependent DNA polymerase)/RNase H-like domain found in reverse transcriptase
MLFGLCNAPAIFQRFMNQLPLLVLGDSCCVYLDDVMLSHDCLESHVKTLGHLLLIFADNNIIGNLKKSKFMVNEIEFLGHKVNAEGITPLPEYKEKANNFLTSKTKKEVQKLMGTLNYIKKFIPNYELHMTKIYELLKGNKRTIKWNEEHEMALSEIKTSIDLNINLRHFDARAQLCIFSDASELAIGGHISQCRNCGKIGSGDNILREISNMEVITSSSSK